MVQLSVFKVEIPTDDGACTHGCRDECGCMIEVEQNRCFVLARNIEAVAKKFPSAMCIIRLGVGYRLSDVGVDP